MLVYCFLLQFRQAVIFVIISIFFTPINEQTVSLMCSQGTFILLIHDARRSVFENDAHTNACCFTHKNKSMRNWCYMQNVVQCSICITNINAAITYPYILSTASSLLHTVHTVFNNSCTQQNWLLAPLSIHHPIFFPPYRSCCHFWIYKIYHKTRVFLRSFWWFAFRCKMPRLAAIIMCFACFSSFQRDSRFAFYGVFDVFPCAWESVLHQCCLLRFHFRFILHLLLAALFSTHLMKANCVWL